jgi:hypothetical protein
MKLNSKERPQAENNPQLPNDLLNIYYDKNNNEVKQLKKQGKEFKKNMFSKNTKKDDYMFLRNEKLETKKEK